MAKMTITSNRIVYDKTWEELISIVNSMSNQAHDDYALTLYDSEGEIINRIMFSGGKKERVVLYYYEDPYGPMPTYILLDPSQTETIEIMAGGALMPVDKPERAVSVEVALEALKFYYDTQRFPAHLNWEKLEW
jgi:hypothetical protein